MDEVERLLKTHRCQISRVGGLLDRRARIGDPRYSKGRRSHRGPVHRAPAGPGRNADAGPDITLQGSLISDREARVQWTSQRPPAHGEMSLKLGADGRLLVHRLNSGDSYIPGGMEVLLRQ